MSREHYVPGPATMAPVEAAPAYPGSQEQAEIGGGPVPPVTPSPVAATGGGGVPSASEQAYGALAPILALGSVGPAVAFVQQQLNTLGASLAVDSIFGSLTQAAVTRLQAERGLAPDGVVGPNTRAAFVDSGGGGGGGGGFAGGDGPGPIEGKAPPPAIPSWYQHRSNATTRGDIKGTIFFGTDQDSFTPDDDAALDDFMKQWGDALQSGDWEVQVLGFADQRGGEDYNDDLAGRRAGHVFEALRQRAGGELPEGSVYMPRGEEQSSMNPDDLARRRRVEIRVVPHQREKNQLPIPGPPGPPKEGPRQPPADWSTEWQLSIEGGGNAGELFSIDLASLLIENMKTGEKKRFFYTGGGIGASAAPVQLCGPGGPYPFTTSSPVPIRVFGSIDNAHLNVGANAPTPTGQFGDFNLPNGLSGEIWVLTGPRAAGADAVFVNTSGTSGATPSIGISGTIGPLI